MLATTYGAVAADWGNDETLKAFNENEWLYSAISVVAQELANIPLKIVSVAANGDEKEVPNHPALDLIRRPNSVHSGAELRETSAIHQELTGNAYWLVDDRDGRGIPHRLYPLDPSKIKISRDEYGEIRFYEYTVGVKTTKFPPEDVVHFRLPNPRDPHYGASPTKAAAFSIDSDMEAAKWNRNFFKNSAKPEFLLFLNKMKQDARARFERKWNQKYSGSEKAHKAGIIEDAGAKVHEFGKSQKDMDFVEQGKALRDKIIANYRVPKSLLGLTEEVNRASMEASIYIFARYTILPRIRRTCEKLTIDYLPLFGRSENLKFSFEDPVPENEEAKLSETQNGLVNGWLTPNEARERHGLGPVRGGDVILIPFNKTPLDDVIAPPLPKKEIGDTTLERDAIDKREVLKAAHLRRHGKHEKNFVKKLVSLFERQEERALSRLRSQKAIKIVDPNTLLDHEQEMLEFLAKTTALYEVILEDGGNSLFSRIGAGTFDFDDPNVRIALSEMQIKFARSVNQTTIESLKDGLAVGISEGEGIPELSKRVKKVFTTAKTSRAKLIARTETTKAFNGGTLLGYEQAGVKEKEWLATEDARTRPKHAEVDGQKIGIKDKFVVDGEFLDYPGDSAGSASNICNCRCTTLP